MNSEEGSEKPQEDEDIEFLLQVDDVESVISYRGDWNENGNLYLIGSVMGWKWKAEKSLSELFTSS